MRDFEVHPIGTAARLAEAAAFAACDLQPVFSPRRNEVTLVGRLAVAHAAWRLDEARRFHAELGAVLSLAAYRDNPLAAVGCAE